MSDTHIITVNGENKEVPWYIEVRHCDYCNKDFEHNGYERKIKFHFVKSNKTKQCCNNCRDSQLQDNLVLFVNDIPPYCDGGTYTYRIFDTEEELLEWLQQNIVQNDSYNVLSYDGRNGIMTVSVRNNHIYWWVYGYTNGIDLKKYLPQWKDVVKEFKEKGYEEG